MHDESAADQATDPDGVSLDGIPLHSTNLLTVLDPSGTILYESPAIERIYGFGQSALVGEQVAEYFHPEDREAALAAFERVVASEEDLVESVELRHRQADGSYKWVESVASANPTPEGNYVINTRDISRRKEREQQLERTNEQLAEFASVLSHDLRNPLNVARLRLQLAADECDSEHLEAVETAHDRIESLIEEMLTRDRSEHLITDTEPVSLEGTARACWDGVVTEASTLRVDSDRRVLAHSARFQQLFENLIRNSVEHSSGDVTVTVGATDDGFYIEDDGSGIPFEERQAVFESGYSQQTDGTGLGLSIVSHIVQAHDWEIEITDGPDGGTRFEITGVEFPD